MEQPIEETIIATATAMNQGEDDEYDSKEKVLKKHFLQEWNIVKAFIDDTVANARVSDPPVVHKIRSIVFYHP